MHHLQVSAGDISVHAVVSGEARGPAILFLHGWPESWATFKETMIELGERYHVVAIDLPGIGASLHPPPSNDKRTLARYVREVIGELDLQHVTLVGHDVGGQIVYAYLHAYPDELSAAVMMNIVIPGVDPWDRVRHNPSIWHFGFHAVQKLPELLVTGKQSSYFDFFYDTISSRPGSVSRKARETYVRAYRRPESLRTGFEWYRAFAQDEKDNIAAKGKSVDIPVLYLRGDREPGDLEDYLRGLRDNGVRNLHGLSIRNSGHFSPDEQPDKVSEAISQFLQSQGVTR